MVARSSRDRKGSPTRASGVLSILFLHPKNERSFTGSGGKSTGNATILIARGSSLNRNETVCADSGFGVFGRLPCFGPCSKHRASVAESRATPTRTRARHFARSGECSQGEGHHRPRNSSTRGRHLSHHSRPGATRTRLQFSPRPPQRQWRRVLELRRVSR